MKVPLFFIFYILFNFRMTPPVWSQQLRPIEPSTRVVRQVWSATMTRSKKFRKHLKIRACCYGERWDTVYGQPCPIYWCQNYFEQWLDELQLFAWTIGNREFDLLPKPILWAKPYCTSLSPVTWTGHTIFTRPINKTIQSIENFIWNDSVIQSWEG